MNLFEDAYSEITSRIQTQISASENELACAETTIRDAIFEDDFETVKVHQLDRVALQEILAGHRNKLTWVQSRYEEHEPKVLEAFARIQKYEEEIARIEAILAPGGQYDQERAGLEARIAELRKRPRSKAEDENLSELPREVDQLEKEKLRLQQRLDTHRGLLKNCELNVESAARALEPLSRVQRRTRDQASFTAIAEREERGRERQREADQAEQAGAADDLARLRRMEEDLAEAEQLLSSLPLAPGGLSRFDQDGRLAYVDDLPAEVRAKVENIGPLRSYIPLVKRDLRDRGVLKGDVEATKAQLAEALAIRELRKHPDGREMVLEDYPPHDREKVRRIPALREAIRAAESA